MQEISKTIRQVEDHFENIDAIIKEESKNLAGIVGRFH